MSTTQTHSSGYRSQISAQINGSVIVGPICSAAFLCPIPDVWPSLSSFWQSASARGYLVHVTVMAPEAMPLPMRHAALQQTPR
jgi:hypothetical protein